MSSRNGRLKRPRSSDANRSEGDSFVENMKSRMRDLVPKLSKWLMPKKPAEGGDSSDEEEVPPIKRLRTASLDSADHIINSIEKISDSNILYRSIQTGWRRSDHTDEVNNTPQTSKIYDTIVNVSNTTQQDSEPTDTPYPTDTSYNSSQVASTSGRSVICDTRTMQEMDTTENGSIENSYMKDSNYTVQYTKTFEESSADESSTAQSETLRTGRDNPYNYIHTGSTSKRSVASKRRPLFESDSANESTPNVSAQKSDGSQKEQPMFKFTPKVYSSPFYPGPTMYGGASASTYLADVQKMKSSTTSPIPLDSPTGRGYLVRARAADDSYSNVRTASRSVYEMLENKSRQLSQPNTSSPESRVQYSYKKQPLNPPNLAAMLALKQHARFMNTNKVARQIMASLSSSCPIPGINKPVTKHSTTRKSPERPRTGKIKVNLSRADRGDNLYEMPEPVELPKAVLRIDNDKLPKFLTPDTKENSADGSKSAAANGSAPAASPIQPSDSFGAKLTLPSSEKTFNFASPYLVSQTFEPSISPNVSGERNFDEHKPKKPRAAPTSVATSVLTFAPASSPAASVSSLAASVSSPAAPVSAPAPAPSPAPVAAPEVKTPEEKDWKCDDCWIKNKSAVDKCAACGASKPGTKKGPEAGAPAAAAAAPPPPLDDVLAAMVRAQKAKWQCSSCLTSNDHDKARCQCCDMEREGPSKELTAKPFTFPKESNITFKFGIDPKQQEQNIAKKIEETKPAAMQIVDSKMNNGMDDAAGNTDDDKAKNVQENANSSNFSFSFNIPKTMKANLASSEYSAPFGIFDLPKNNAAQQDAPPSMFKFTPTNTNSTSPKRKLAAAEKTQGFSFASNTSVAASVSGTATTAAFAAPAAPPSTVSPAPSASTAAPAADSAANAPSSSATPAGAPLFSFRSEAPSTAPSSTSMFSFGATNDKQSTTFGAKTDNNASPFSTFSISAQSTAGEGVSASKPPAPAFSFGGTAASGGSSGASAASTSFAAAPQPGPFASSSQPAPSFGSQLPQSPFVASVRPTSFGAPAPTQPSAFGAPSSSQPTVFGAPSSTQPLVFGATAQNQSNTFGASSQSLTPAFAAASQNQTFGGNMTQTQTSGFGGFGASTQNQPAAFGAAGASQPSVFGANNANQPPAFGTNNANPPPAFGANNANQPPAFGANNASQPTVFGASNANQPSVFGSNNASQPPAFGANNANQPSAFGANNANQPSAFGASNTSQPSAFGASNTSQPLAFGATNGSQTSAFGTSNMNQTAFGASGTSQPFGASQPLAFGGGAAPAFAAPAPAQPPAFAVPSQPSAPAAPMFNFGSQGSAPALFGFGQAPTGGAFNFGGGMPSQPMEPAMGGVQFNVGSSPAAGARRMRRAVRRTQQR